MLPSGGSEPVSGKVTATFTVGAGPFEWKAECLVLEIDRQRPLTTLREKLVKIGPERLFGHPSACLR